MGTALMLDPTPFEAGLLAAARAREAGGSGAAALAKFAERGAPHRRLEPWKWTDLRNMLREDIPFANDEGAAPDAGAFAGLDPVIIAVGAPASAQDLSGGPLPEGIEISREDYDLAESLADHPMALAAAAVGGPATVIRVKAGAKVFRPILLRGAADGAQVHGRVVVEVGDGAEATLIEHYDGAGASLCNVAVEGRIGPRARLSRIALQDGGADAATVATASFTLDAGAAFEQTALLTGGKAVRFETRLDYAGEGARADLRAAAILSGARHADATSLIAHNAPACETRQAHKSAVRDRGRGIFQGKFYVARAGQQTDADMQANALLLSETAEANHKPELEIYADNVECAHGSTAGALDEDALFYLRQRGLDETAARGLLVEAFLAEVVDELDDGVGAVFRKRIADWLAASDADAPAKTLERGAA